jgi:hypothetical protein
MAHFPIVRGSAIDGHGWSAGDTQNPFLIIELEVVARAGIEPATRGYVPGPSNGATNKNPAEARTCDINLLY